MSHKLWCGGSIAGGIPLVVFISECFDVSLKIALCSLMVLYVLTFIIVSIYCYVCNCSEEDNSANPLTIVMNFEKDIQKWELGKQGIEKVLQRVCDCCKNYFDRVCECECSVSIKLNVSCPESDGVESVRVENVCRDWQSANKRDIPKYALVDHYVIKNTAYMSIVNMLNEGKSDVYYMNNSISKTSGYCNTSSEVYPNKILPYEAEWVFPIISLYESPGSAWNMKGFFCVDSKKACVFKHNDEIVILMKLLCSGLNRII